ncbi:hypothetical protein FLONG3_1566 [Fusarium longipes]|uniref:Uncharacterized protein n=1 Tax=Fusarium longipes TaxID=694270 RepID=A0A395T7S7_9HYPO|nr:hypothetical protein FLONG3_1566 [Fusarium longipes]
MPSSSNTSPSAWGLKHARNQDDILEGTSQYHFRRTSQLMTYSISNNSQKEAIIAGSPNGFVWSACHAFNEGVHLVIRPDDVWLAIVQQLSICCCPHQTNRAMTEKDFDVAMIRPKDIRSPSALNQEMDYLVARNCLTVQEKDNFLPDFTTTRLEDKTVAAILLLGKANTEKLDHNLRFGRNDGIPSISLLGEAKDWVTILEKLDRFNDENVRLFVNNIKPIIKLFHYAARVPRSKKATEFFATMVRKTPPNDNDDKLVTGWITAFCYFDSEGQIRRTSNKYDAFPGRNAHFNVPTNTHAVEQNEQDDMVYQPISLDDIPAGTASMPLLLLNGKNTHNCTILGGSISIESLISQRGSRGYKSMTGWILCVDKKVKRSRKRTDFVYDSNSRVLMGMESVAREIGRCTRPVLT